MPNSRDPWALLRTVPGVSLDRVNIAGNETGQQSAFVAKGARQGDAVWTMDGVPITDMATAGASPTYFDYDAFDEIQISTGGNDINQATGGVGLNFVVKRGTNQLRGTARGYFTGDELEATNLPDDWCACRRVTPETADHNQQISEVGIDVGGPILKDKLFFWGSIAKQDIRLYRQSARGTDRTMLKTYNAKVNWQATPEGHGQLPVLQRRQDQERPRARQRAVRAGSARYNQGNFYTDTPLHGLWKWEDNRVMSSSLVPDGETPTTTPASRSSRSASPGRSGISPMRGPTFGSTNANYFTRPQHTINVDNNYFQSMGDTTHEFKFGGGWRRTESYARTSIPAARASRTENSGHRLPRARLPRGRRHEPRGRHRRLLRRHHRDGPHDARPRPALRPAVRPRAGLAPTEANGAFPNLVPGINFAGYDPPFYWNNLTPRVGMTYALDENHKTHPPRELQPQRRAALGNQRERRLCEPELVGRVSRVSVDRRQRRSPGADQRGQGERAAARVGRRVQHREPDGGDLGQSDRS